MRGEAVQDFFTNLYKKCASENEKYIELFKLYLTIVNKNSIFVILGKELIANEKEKILFALGDISKSIIIGFKEKNLAQMEEAVLKLILLYKHIEDKNTNEEK